VAGNPYSISCSGAADSDYSPITYQAGTLTVTPVGLIITASSATVTYGDNAPTISPSYSGFVNGDSATTLNNAPNAAPACTTTYTKGSPVSGNYTTSCAGAADTDYTISYVAGKVTVYRATLTVTADSKSATYGSTSLPPLTASYSGFVNGENSSVLSGAPSLTTSAMNTSHVGVYPIVAAVGTLSAANYKFTFVNGIFSITPAPLTITADSKSKPYGAPLPALTVSYSGLVNGDTPATFNNAGNTAPTISTTATASSHVAGNPYPITASGAVDGDYSISYVAGTLTVTPVALTITADSKMKAYGAGLPPLTVSYSGLVNGDTPATFNTAPNTAPTITTTATASSHVAGSPYTITASGAADSDYTISYVGGQLSVTPVALLITASSPSVTYGDGVPTITAGYTGLVNGDSAATFSSSPNTAPTCNTTYTQGSTVDGGPYSTSCTGAADTDYTISYAGGAVTVNKKQLTVTAPSYPNLAYGQPMPDLTPTITGFVLGQDKTVIGDASGESLPTCTSGSPGYVQGSSVAGSTFTVSCNGGSDNNYSFNYVNGKITVVAQEAPVAYIGQTTFVTSGSSSTTAQVALSASLQDATGDLGNVGTATLTFTDLLSGKVLATGVKVSPVSNTNVTQGTANTIVTLSTGQYGAQEYLIQVSVDKGNYQNCQQTGAYGTTCQTGYPAPGGTNPWPVDTSSTQYAAAHPTVTVMIPPTQYSMQGVGSIPILSSAAGSFGNATSANYTIGMQYNNKGTNPQGQIQLTLERAAGNGYPAGTYYIKSNSISSMAFSNAPAGQPSKDVTIYTKASIYSVSSSGAMTSVDGNVTLRVDAHEGCATSPNCSSQTSPDLIGFTVLSSKTGNLYYSNNWIYNNAVAGWSTVEQSMPGLYQAVQIN
jgi:hypothetical protein